jgi:hypothetical protein
MWIASAGGSRCRKFLQDLGQRKRKTGKQYRLFKFVPGLGGSNFGFPLARNIAIRKARVGVHDPHRMDARVDVFRYLQYEAWDSTLAGASGLWQAGGP